MNWFRKELENISESDIEAPQDKIMEGDSVVGTLESTEVRRIWELRRRTKRHMVQQVQQFEDSLCKEGINALKEEMSKSHDPATCKRCTFFRQLELLKDKTDLLDQLFWACVRHELSKDARIKGDKIRGDNNVVGIGLRKGWKIVIYNIKHKQEDPLVRIPLGIGLPN